MPRFAETYEVVMLAGVVLTAVVAGWTLPWAWTWAGERVSDRRIRRLSERVHQLDERQDWPAVRRTLDEVVRSLRRRRQTADVRVDLARALHDKAYFAETLGGDDEAARLRLEVYRLATSVDGLAPHELAAYAYEVGAVLCVQRRYAEAIAYAEQAVAWADPDSALAVMARNQAGSALRRTGQVTRALQSARDAVRLAESATAVEADTRSALAAVARLVEAMALADSGEDGRQPATEAMEVLEREGSEVLLARACYVNGYVARDAAQVQQYALRAKEMFERLEHDKPGRYGADLAEVDRLLERA